MTFHQRAFGPKPAGDPSIGQACPACGKPFAAGDYTTLIPLGPGDYEESRKRAREGRPYNAVAVQVHYACATGSDAVTDAGKAQGA